MDLNNYYFTYGSSKIYPYDSGWTKVIAKDEAEALDIFNFFHVGVDTNILLCAMMYEEDEFVKTSMWTEGNRGAYQQEILCFVELIPFKVKTTENIDIEELRLYLNHLRANKAKDNLAFERIVIEIDGDYVNIKYKYTAIPFERIRRITGYLVGDLNRFNNAKKSEVSQRVKHNLGESLDMSAFE